MFSWYFQRNQGIPACLILDLNIFFLFSQPGDDSSKFRVRQRALGRTLANRSITMYKLVKEYFYAL